MARLKLFLLGAPRIERDGALVAVERHKVIALIAYLAVTGQPQRRDTLATLLWPDADQAHARGALRRDISVLNKTLGMEGLDVAGQAVGLRRSAGFWVDVEQFHTRLADCQTHGHPEAEVCPACIAPLTEAVSLYRDDFLAGFTLRDSPAFDEWQFFQTEHLRRALAGALERLARGHSAQGEFEPAIGSARRWLALDPLHEPAQRYLMQVYAWSGQRSAALRQYGECVRVLERELGAPPEIATAQLYEAIKQNRASPSGAAPSFGREAQPARQHNLPAHTQPTSSAGSALERERVPTNLEPAIAPLDRIVRGQLVGRAPELAAAETLWRRAVAGESQALLVSGEPGIGKTRLVREITTLAEAAGASALVGTCYAEGGAPYAPIAQIIRAILGDSPGAGRDFGLPGFVVADLIALAPDLRLRYPDLPANPRLDPQSEQQRLFDSVIALWTGLAAATPLLLVVEDIHWADGGTLMLLRHLVRRARKLRLLLVLTYRDTEAELDDAQILNAVLLDLNRERLAEQLKLPRLSRAQTHDLLAAMLATGGEISPEFLDGIYRETEGNPFFVEEVCKALIDEGKLYYAGGHWRRSHMATIALPQSIKGAILARVEKLSAPTQETLRVAAVLGREFDFDTLRGASDLDEEALIAALERAERAHLIGEARQAGRMTFGFAHALIPFTLRASVSGLRLQRLHRRAAVAIEHLRPDDVEALAYHFVAAGEREQGIVYSRRAAQRAEAVYAYDAAIQHLHTTLDLLHAGAPIELRLAVLEQLADVYCLRGERTQAMPLYQEALELWRGLARADIWIAVRLQRKIVQAVTDTIFRAPFSQFAAVAPAGAAARASLAAMLPLLEGQPPQPEIVRLLATLSHDAWFTPVTPDWDAAERYARSAVAVAEQLDTPAELSTALRTLANVEYARGRLRERLQVALRRLALSRDPRFGDLRERLSILWEAGAAFADVGDYTQALPYLREAESLAGQIHAVDQQVYALRLQSRCWLHLDRWDDTLTAEEASRNLAQHYPREYIGPTCLEIALSATVHALRGQVERASALREEAYAIMAAGSGPPEYWRRMQHY